MNIQEALMIIKNKYLEEQKDVTESDTSSNYRDACDKYPATMQIAHTIFALEFRSSN